MAEIAQVLIRSNANERSSGSKFHLPEPNAVFGFGVQSEGPEPEPSRTFPALHTPADQEDIGSFPSARERRCVKAFKYQSAEVKARYRGTAKLLNPLEQSIVYPLALSEKKQTIPAELKDGLLDFFEAVIGGDGISYAMVLQLQSYLQFHNDALKSLEILEPQLQVWHTKWTDIVQTHWGRTSGKSTNPASPGHIAGKIGRVAPSHMHCIQALRRQRPTAARQQPARLIRIDPVLQPWTHHEQLEPLVSKREIPTQHGHLRPVHHFK
ncbi:hypothetical protein B0H14DRAFT_2574957 [Mycena olivaceomarginata]|nr:hypothetical protein B0H14DRAFT_2574957 [Mycena olivaceomarginata]